MYVISVKENAYTIRRYDNDNLNNIELGILCITPVLGIIIKNKVNYLIDMLKTDKEIGPDLLKLLLLLTKKEIERSFSYLEIAPINFPSVDYKINLMFNLNNEDIISLHVLIDHLINKFNEETVYLTIHNPIFIIFVYYVLYTIISNNMLFLETNELSDRLDIVN
jgi:hypothetical protein